MTKQQLYTFLIDYLHSLEEPPRGKWFHKALDGRPNLYQILLDETGERLKPKDVYDFLLPGNGKCRTCGNPTKFQTFEKGYKEYCSAPCFSSRPRKANTKEKPQKKKVSAKVEKPPVITEKSVLPNSGGTMHGKQEKPTIAVEYEQPRVVQLADLKQFGVRIPNPVKPRISSEQWKALGDANELVANIEERRKKRAVRLGIPDMDRILPKPESQSAILKSENTVIHGDREFRLEGLEPQALDTLLYEMHVPLHLFDRKGPEITYFSTTKGKQKFFVPNLTLDGKVVIEVADKTLLTNYSQLQETRDRFKGVVWSGRRMLLLITDHYGNILSANLDELTDFELQPLGKEALAQLAKMICELLNR